MKYIVLFFLTIFFLSKAYSQTVQLNGKMADVRHNAIPFVNITVYQGESLYGTSSDSIGNFSLVLPMKGEYLIKISSIGYRNLEQIIKLFDDKDLGIIILTEDLLGLQEVVVTGTLKESFVSESPVKISVYTAKYLQQTIAPTNLMESLKLMNGVQEISSCALCNTNSISINGLPGAYTAVLIDGTPAYGNLASVYGLNGIPINATERIEVIKGPNSTLYGSEALAGVINVITKNPQQQPIFSLDLMGTSDLEAFTNISFAPKLVKASVNRYSTCLFQSL